MLISLIFTVFTSPNPIYDLEQLIKLIVILIGGITFFNSNSSYARVAFLALKTIVVINVVLLLLGKYVSPVFAGVASGDGRWGTVFNPPGTLAILGVGIIVYGAYLFSFSKTYLHGIALILVSYLLIYLEASRSAYILTFFALIYILIIWLWERKPWHVYLTFLSFLLIMIIAIPKLFNTNSFVNHRIVRLTEGSSGLVSGGSSFGNWIEKYDPNRFLMLREGIIAVSRHPILGTGMGTTRVTTSEGRMFVHMAYLQLWADCGLLGFIGFVWLAWGWIFWLPRVIQVLRCQDSLEQRVLIINSIFMLFAFGFYNFLHPFSTEWTQWLMFIIPYAIFWETVNLSIKKKEG